MKKLFVITLLFISTFSFSLTREEKKNIKYNIVHNYVCYIWKDTNFSPNFKNQMKDLEAMQNIQNNTELNKIQKQQFDFYKWEVKENKALRHALEDAFDQLPKNLQEDLKNWKNMNEKDKLKIGNILDSILKKEDIKAEVDSLIDANISASIFKSIFKNRDKEWFKHFGERLEYLVKKY